MAVGREGGRVAGIMCHSQFGGGRAALSTFSIEKGKCGGREGGREDDELLGEKQGKSERERSGWGEGGGEERGR